MIACFPSPYEDELLYSWLARYFCKSGYLAYTLAVEDLFENKQTKPSIEFISRLTGAALEAIERYVPRTMMIEKHTMFPYYARFLDRERRCRAFDAMVNMEDGYFNLLCVSKSKEHVQRYLRYCPKCVAADREKYGETYWHRIHQMRGVDLCPTHGCKLVDSKITIDSRGSPSLITAEEVIPQMLEQYHDGNELEWELARYVADVFQSDIDMQSDVQVGDFLQSRMEGTKYLSLRGEKRNMTLLHDDFRRYYSGTSIQPMEQWQVQKVFSGNRTNIVDLCMLAMFLNIPSVDLVHMQLPDRSQSDAFDAEIVRLHERGLNYRQIADQMNASYDVVKAIGEGLYGKYHYRAENPQKSGTKRFNWAQIDEETLPRVKAILHELNAEIERKPERISIGRIERILGWPKKRLRQCPMCVAEIERYTLSQEDYWGLLVDWATKKLISDGREVNITAIMRLTNMRKRDFSRIGFEFCK